MQKGIWVVLIFLALIFIGIISYSSRDVLLAPDTEKTSLVSADSYSAMKQVSARVDSSNLAFPQAKPDENLLAPLSNDMNEKLVIKPSASSEREETS